MKLTENSKNAYNGQDYLEPWVSYTKQTEEVNYNKGKDWSQEYMTLEFLGNGDFRIWVASYGWNNPTFVSGMSYSLNEGEWVDFEYEGNFEYGTVAQSYAVQVHTGDMMRLRANGASATGSMSEDRRNLRGTYFYSDSNYNVMGNVMSLLYGDDFRTCSLDLTDIEHYGMITFKAGDNDVYHAGKGPVDASNFVLPATALTENCYQGMFTACEDLISAPKLNAIELADGCYCDMFSGCNLLTESPVLPAETLAEDCYMRMFHFCNNMLRITCLATSDPSGNGFGPSEGNYWVDNSIDFGGTLVVSENSDSSIRAKMTPESCLCEWRIEDEDGNYIGTHECSD